MNRENNQIRFLLMQASIGLSIIAIILLLYGAYLFNLQLISKSSIFITVGIPATLSVLCIWRARK